MPWKEKSVMDQRLEFVTLAAAEGANIRKLCRQFGVSPDTGYTWIGRYRERGVEALADRSRRPRTSPQRSPEAVERMVVQTRRRHPAWGGRKIRRVLQDQGEKEVPAESTISDILRRHGLLHTDDAAPRGPFKRFQRERPNQLWQMDFKGHRALARGGRCHPFTVLDDHSRYCLCLRACADEQEQTVKQCLTDTFRRYGVPEQLLCDNGSPWGSAGEEGCYTGMDVWLLRLGILVLHGRPRHPQTQGKEERFHRTLEAELLCRQDLLDNTHAQSLFDPWCGEYNALRPHQALGLQTPSARYMVSPRSFPEKLPDLGYQPGEVVRKVERHGRLSYLGTRWRIGRAFIGELLALRPTPLDSVLNACYGPHAVAELDLRARTARSLRRTRTADQAAEQPA